MRIMVDTNVLVSAILYPKSIPAQALVKVLAGDRMVICSYVIEELHEVFERKFKKISKAALDIFLMKMSFEMVFVPSIIMPEDYRAFVGRFQFGDRGKLYISITMQSAFYGFAKKNIANEANLYLVSEPALLDVFIKQLKSVHDGVTKIAFLECVDL